MEVDLTRVWTLENLEKICKDDKNRSDIIINIHQQKDNEKIIRMDIGEDYKYGINCVSETLLIQKERKIVVRYRDMDLKVTMTKQNKN